MTLLNKESAFFTRCTILPILPVSIRYRRESAKPPKSKFTKAIAEVDLDLNAMLTRIEVDVHIPDICHFFYTGKIFGE